MRAIIVSFAKNKKSRVKDMTFVLTGQLERMERDDARDLVVKCGGRVVSAISGKVNYLVAGDEAGQAKLAKVQPPVYMEECTILLMYFTYEYNSWSDFVRWYTWKPDW